MTEANIENQIALPQRRSDRAITLAHRMQFALLWTLVKFFRILGIEASAALAGRFTRLIGPLLRSISRRAEDNLSMAFPTMTKRERDVITAGVWENLGRTAAEFAHLQQFNLASKNNRVILTGAEIIDDINKTGKPAIFISGHFANWEVGSICFHQLGLKYGVVYRAANNPLIDEFIIQQRAQVMTRLQIPKGKRGGRQLMSTLKAGTSIAMLVDQKLNDGIAVPFFDRPAMTAPAAARLSLKYNAPIIPVEIERLPRSRFRVVIGPKLHFTATSDTNKDVYGLTLSINKKIEDFVRKRPDQWLWLHRRWPKEEIET